MRRTSRSIRPAMLGALISACMQDGPGGVVVPPPPPPVPVVVDRTEIDTDYANFTASAYAGSSLQGKPRVRVTVDGVPVPNATVYWSVVEGMVFPASSETDNRGVAELSNWRLGPTVGQQVLVAALGQSESAKRLIITADARRRP